MQYLHGFAHCLWQRGGRTKVLPSHYGLTLDKSFSPGPFCPAQQRWPGMLYWHHSGISGTALRMRSLDNSSTQEEDGVHYHSDANHPELAQIPQVSRRSLQQDCPHFRCQQHFCPQAPGTFEQLASHSGFSWLLQVWEFTRMIYNIQRSAILSITVLLERT